MRKMKQLLTYQWIKSELLWDEEQTNVWPEKFTNWSGQVKVLDVTSQVARGVTDIRTLILLLIISIDSLEIQSDESLRRWKKNANTSTSMKALINWVPCLKNRKMMLKTVSCLRKKNAQNTLLFKFEQSRATFCSNLNIYGAEVL